MTSTYTTTIIQAPKVITKLVVLLVACLFSISPSTAQVVQTFNASGSFVAPAGVTRVVVDCYGGGGRGGARTSSGQGGGGGGGAYASSVITVVPGNSYTVTVGAGSASGTTPGGDSWFINTTTLMAKGGTSVADNVSTGAAGGAAASSVGSKRFSGGAGVNGGSSLGGGGGSSAGYAGVGATGLISIGGTAPAGGGNGGGGATLDGNGSGGSAPGGGGGGAVKLLFTNRTGGAGGTGRVVVSYYTNGTCMTSTTGINYIPDAGCASSTYASVPIIISGLPTTLGTAPGNAILTNVQLVMAHTFNSDMQITLTSPAGTTRNLVLSKFGSGDNLGDPATCPNTLFTLQDGGASMTTTNTNNVTGAYAPEQTLAGFTGDPNGAWLLNVCDNAANDVGVIRYVKLNFCASPTATFAAVDNCASSQFNVQVNVTSLGTAASANLSYTVNGSAPANVPNIGAGITTIGPFAVGSEVIATVSSAISGCGSVQGAIYSNCPYNIPCGTTVTVNHCYRNTDTRTFTFVSSSAFETVTLSFIAGTMQATDVIRAYSGTNNMGTPIPSLTGSFASLNGVSGTSSDNSLFLEIDSDGSNSCSTGQQTSWTMEARCTPGCVDPDGVVTVNTDCANYNFNIDVEVSFAGDASSTTLRYTVNGGAPTFLPGLAESTVVNIGPFAIDDIVNVRLLHENNASCDRNLGNFTDNNTCPGAENCANALNLGTQTSPVSGTTIGRTNDFSFACGTATANTAPDAIYYIDVPNGAQLDIRQQSNTYDSQHYVRFGGACPGTTAIACVDNDASEIGFVTWTNTTGTTQRVWWIQDGFGAATGNFVLQWQVTTCPVAPGPPTVNTASYVICQNGTVPGGQGLSASCANVAQTATNAFPGGGLISEGTTITTRATMVVPALPVGAVVTAARLKLTSVVANTGLFGNAQRQNLRVALSGSYTLAETQLTATSGPGTIAPDPVVNLVSFPAAGGTIDLRTRQTSDQLWTSPDVNIATATIEVDYSVPTLVRWYSAPIAGTLIFTGPLFDPVGQGAVNNITPGTTNFYATCGYSACENVRASTAFTVNQAANAGTNGTLTICDNAAPVPLASSLGGSPQSGGSWAGPSTIVGGLYAPVSMQPGSYIYTVNGAAPCPNSSATVSVNETPSTLWYADTDNDGFGDPNTSIAACVQPVGYSNNATDLCPTDANKQAPGACGCGVADTDTDGDNVADCNDPCPLLPGLSNGDICDANPGTGYTLGTITACSCLAVACNNQLNIEFQSDGTSSTGWELRQQGSNTLVQSGGGILPPSPGYAEATCLPNGCFYLVVTDNAGDGITGGGYILRTQGNPGQRIIDNRNNFTSGYFSRIENGEGFCLPLGTDRLVSTSCDKLDWRTTPCGAEYIVANDVPAVTTQYGLNNATSGYELWWFNPNGGYSFRRFQNHNTANGITASATRACHFQLNAWSGNQLQDGILYNVRVRSRANGVNSEWGAACRFKIDNVAAQCPRTKLMDIAGNPYYSCGSSRPLGTTQASLIHARPVTRMNNNCNEATANRYQFRFRIPAENITIIKTSNVGQYFIHANAPLQCGKTYEVDVRASFDGGTTWCYSSDPYGDVCLFTVTCAAVGGGQNMTSDATDAHHNAKLTMYPNPNRGDQLMLNLNPVADGLNTVSVDIYDTFGKRVSARTIAVQDGFINTMLELNGTLAAGMYTVSITAGGQVYTERLVIQP